MHDGEPPRRAAGQREDAGDHLEMIVAFEACRAAHKLDSNRVRSAAREHLVTRVAPRSRLSRRERKRVSAREGMRMSKNRLGLNRLAILKVNREYDDEYHAASWVRVWEIGRCARKSYGSRGTGGLLDKLD